MDTRLGPVTETERIASLDTLRGFALLGSVSRIGQVGIVVAIWVFQLIVSPIWLRHFHLGPFEWAWRSLTYWQPQPFRRAAISEPVTAT